MTAIPPPPDGCASWLDWCLVDFQVEPWSHARAELAALRKTVADADMERARHRAWKAVIVQFLAMKARNGEESDRIVWWLAKADEAARAVRPEDLVVAHVNSAQEDTPC